MGKAVDKDCQVTLVSKAKQTGLGAALVLACAVSWAMAPLPPLTLAAIPYPLELGSEPGAVAASPGGLRIVANKGSDLFVTPDGASIADKTPRALFMPVGDFILSAKVDAHFQREFDGGALIVYVDQVHWAKLLFERARSGKTGISSTVAKGVGDDAHHGAAPVNSIHLKIARRKDMFVFYTSVDGAAWNMVRTFSMGPAAKVKVGFSSQSPVGERFSAGFSDIRFRAASFKDYWQGE